MNNNLSLKIQILVMLFILFLVSYSGSVAGSIGFMLGAMTTGAMFLYILNKIFKIKQGSKDVYFWRNLLVVTLLWLIIMNWNQWYKSFVTGYETGYQRSQQK